VASIALLCLCSGAIAAPYVPKRDDVVLARLPAGARQPQVQALRQQLADQPANLDAALRLSRAWIDAGRREGDPRFFSYAQATLSPWVQQPEAPAEALVLMATSLQSLHRFDEAQTLLTRALQADPGNAQAWLTKATLLQVRGNFAQAVAACANLIEIADPHVALACVASARSMSGALGESYRALSKLTAPDPNADDPQVRSWLLGQLGEMAVRLGDTDAAQEHFLAALAADPQDNYVKGELSDLYLRQARYDEVLSLLKDSEGNDALLLRLAIADHDSGTARGKWARMYQERLDAALRAGDMTHSREHARFLLEVRGDTAAALQMAERNWQVQREPADIRIYWNAARESGKSAREAIDHWVEENRYQDVTLQSSAHAAGTAL